MWFPDTSALVTLAVHLPLQRAVAQTLSAHRLVLAKAVVAELESLAATSDRTAAWARASLGQLDWLGAPVRLDDPAGTQLAVEIQEQLAAGPPLVHDMQHYGEAAVISMASRARTLAPLFLCDDYNARVAAKRRNVKPLSVHKLMHLMIIQGKISAQLAASFAEALYHAGRAQDYTAEELASGHLSRVGQP